MTFGDKWKGFMGQTPDEDILKIITEYKQMGGNFLDTANVYQAGQSEEKIAWAIKKAGINRDEFVIATKYSNKESGSDPNLRGNNKKSLLHAVNKSLERLNTNYIDLLYVHFWDFTMETDELMRALDDVVRSGKVLHIGISDAPAFEVATANTMSKFHGWSQFCCYQGKYSLVCREVENEVIPMCEKFNMGFIPWAVLGQGKLTGTRKKNEDTKKDVTRRVDMNDLDYKIQDEVIKISEELNVTPSQVAINWMMKKSQIHSCLVGPRTYDQFIDNMKSLEFDLSKDQMKTLDKISEESIKPIFPRTMIGDSIENNQWLYWMADKKYKIE